MNGWLTTNCALPGLADRHHEVGAAEGRRQDAEHDVVRRDGRAMRQGEEFGHPLREPARVDAEILRRVVHLRGLQTGEELLLVGGERQPLGERLLEAAEVRRRDARDGRPGRVFPELLPAILRFEVAGDLREQHVLLERLHEVVDGAEREGARLVARLVLRGREDHRDVRELLVLLELRRDVIAVHLGHHHVEEDEVRPDRPDGFEREGAARRAGDLVACLREVGLADLPDDAVVVDEEDERLELAGRRGRRGHFLAVACPGNACFEQATWG